MINFLGCFHCLTQCTSLGETFSLAAQIWSYSLHLLRVYNVDVKKHLPVIVLPKNIVCSCLVQADSVEKVVRRPESETQLAKPVKLHDSSTPCLTEYLKCFPSVAFVGCYSCLLTGGFCDRLSVLSDLVERHYLVTFARCFSPGMVCIRGNIPPRFAQVF